MNQIVHVKSSLRVHVVYNLRGTASILNYQKIKKFLSLVLSSSENSTKGLSTVTVLYFHGFGWLEDEGYLIQSQSDPNLSGSQMSSIWKISILWNRNYAYLDHCVQELRINTLNAEIGFQLVYYSNQIVLSDH